MVVVRDLGEGRAEVCFITGRQTLIVYSSVGAGDDLRQAISWAMDWASRRRICKVYLDARTGLRDDAKNQQERVSRRLANQA